MDSLQCLLNAVAAALNSQFDGNVSGGELMKHIITHQCSPSYYNIVMGTSEIDSYYHVQGIKRGRMTRDIVWLVARTPYFHNMSSGRWSCDCDVKGPNRASHVH